MIQVENKDLYCPIHKEKLVLRVIKQGKQKGQESWGCRTWSKTRCNYTRPFSTDITKKKNKLSLKQKLLSKIKNKNGKISLIKIVGFILMIPIYLLVFINKIFIDSLPTRKKF